jgi:hypothetical protein
VVCARLLLGGPRRTVVGLLRHPVAGTGECQLELGVMHLEDNGAMHQPYARLYCFLDVNYRHFRPAALVRPGSGDASSTEPSDDCMYAESDVPGRIAAQGLWLVRPSAGRSFLSCKYCS